MKTTTLTRAALAVPMLALGVAAAQPAPTLSPQRMATATYVILDPVIEGNQNLVNADQRRSILEAMKRDSGGALKRRYPQATIAAGPTANAIQVRPVFVAPSALVPWNKLGARLELQMPEGQKYSVSDSFGISVLLRYRAEFVNYMYDQLATRLPR
ncbi:hypothetical protein GCM10008956_16580 [Deinococcus arenae]|uniref:Uncharacterized protein n=2 Tax=Deinococcus TaxID=1298 RepID=A0A8H9GP33_9DEIO|nr:MULTISPECIES: hypothetical protein [Deinococcus]ALW89524.1 hypothetical protein AUC44_11975 [Deinococcus actinosclerus]AWT36305.1 hypothetical protein DM785_12610 [Deinococcus actinosclerus]GGM40854.1 hypothetical protein GCM10008956_16580 [Deinococcus arenae]